MNRPHDDIDAPVDDIHTWYFLPYTDAPGYSDTDPLYCVVVVVKDVGDVMIYDRPGDAGAFHSLDPSIVNTDPFPPTDAFKTALALILTNPGENHDVEDLVEEMYPWEHHHLEVLINAANSAPELLPAETKWIINTVLGESLGVEVEEGGVESWFSELVSEEQEQFLSPFTS